MEHSQLLPERNNFSFSGLPLIEPVAARTREQAAFSLLHRRAFLREHNILQAGNKERNNFYQKILVKFLENLSCFVW